ncbi:hypothetical protein RR46_08713 [Papilio xuthus]|uniref:Proteasome assembly chaperone 4 n=1 Tax=Papilio xuthus TaxID=66420 RepID=A0A194QDY7_PAPXU|nr:hypothetical protein RR46_08713 [Papilio xuthus]
MSEGQSPGIVTSKRLIKYRTSSWQVHDFEVWSGEFLCRIAVLKMEDSVLIWVGSTPADLGEVALGVPPRTGRQAASSSLIGGDAGAAPLARQLAAALDQPVYVCCGSHFDRFSMPLVVQGLITEIKSRPECFNMEQTHS